MRNRPQLLTVVFIAVLCAGKTVAQTPAFDPRGWKGTQSGPATEVLTLASPHLSEAPATVSPVLMTAVLDKLAAYHPEIITAEGISGEQGDHLRRYASLYPGSFEAWCSPPDIAQKALGVDGPTASGEAEKMLAAWPVDPGPAKRRRLAALFLAAGDNPSARVQWLRLPLEERHPGDGITQDTLKLVERAGAKPNETYEIAVALAVRLGLERVYSVDDHTADGSLPDEGQPFSDAIQTAWKVAPSKAVETARQMESSLEPVMNLRLTS